MMKKIWSINLVLCIFLILTSCSKSNNQKESHSNPKNDEIQIWNLSSIEVGNLDFGIVDFDKQKLLKIDIVNDGDENILDPLTLSSPDFQLVVNNCQSLLVGEKCSIKVSFNAKGKSLNYYTGNLLFGNTVNVITAQINRTGEVLDSVFINNGNPVSSYNFGNIEFNHLLLKSIFIKNTGTLNQSDSVSVSGSDFSIAYDACSGKQIKPQGQCLVKVLLSGQGKAGSVLNNLQYGSKSLPLSASVKTQSEVAQENSEFVFVYDNAISSGPIDLETINLNSFKEYKVYVKNIGTRSGKVLTSSYADKLDVFYNGCDNVILNPNQSCLLRAHLNSPSKGSFSTTLNANVDYQVNAQSVQWIVREPGDKIDCSQNIVGSNVAEITWTGTNYTSCELISCNSNYTQFGNSCVLTNQSRSCTVQPDNSNSGIESSTDGGVTWGSCSSYVCNSNFTNVAGSCVLTNQSRSCSITNGSGLESSTDGGQSWSSCSVISCIIDYEISGNTCILSLTHDFFRDGSGVALYEFNNNVNDFNGLFNASLPYFSNTYSSGKANNSINFEDGRAMLTPAIITNPSQATFSFWVKPSLTTNAVVFFGIPSIGWNASNQRGFAFSYNYSAQGYGDGYTAPGNSFHIYNSGNVNVDTVVDIGSTAIIRNQWNHVVFSFAQPNLKIYVNGVLQGTASHPSWTVLRAFNTVQNGTQWAIGDSPYTSNINTFSMDQFRTFNRSVTAPEVLELYNEFNP